MNNRETTQRRIQTLSSKWRRVQP